MYPPPNEVYTAFSFIGFVLCAIPFYWHLEAWNTGTCLYMAWAGIGCLVQCVNSIIWNNNVIIRAKVYCDIAIRIQVALNVAIPACSLCINRRLYKITNMKAVMITRSEKRRAIVIDLLIGIGIPILQMILHYIVSGHRFNLYEDFGPSYSAVLRPPTFFLIYAWPLVIGCVSLVYCVLTIHTLLKREHQFRQVMSSNRNLNRSRYFRLMALSGIEILGTIPVAIYWIVYNSKNGVTPWVSWEDVHSYYYRIPQFANVVWKNDQAIVVGLEGFRWSLVACAFVFFAFFGFADEARQHYRLVYTSLASRIGISTTSTTLHGSSHATSSFTHMKSKAGVTVSVVTTGDKRDSMGSIIDRLSIPSISMASDYKPDFKITEFSPSDSMASSSLDSLELESQGRGQLGETTVTVPPAIHLLETDKSTPHPYATDVTDKV